MAENCKVAWCHNSFNAWWGCTHSGDECLSCYAETFAKRVGVGWGNESRRRFFGEKHNQEPLKWNARAEKTGIRERVFCGSMMDVMELLPPSHPDAAQMDIERGKLWKLIEATPHLDWLLLTKRPQNYMRLFPKEWLSSIPRNVWMGTTAGNQDGVDRRLQWLATAAEVIKPSVTFASCEPLLGPITLGQFSPSWLIVGGESHANPRKARPFNAAWAQSLIGQCRDRGIVPFFKQFGSNPVDANDFPMCFKHRKGEDPNEWPVWAQVQEFPNAAP